MGGDWKARAAAATRRFEAEHRAELRPDPAAPTPRHRTPEDPADRLTVADVARLRDVGRVAAHRWLVRNAAQYLFREGRFVFILAADYARLTAPPALEQIERRLTALEVTVAEHDRRLDVHAVRLRVSGS